MAKKNAKAAKSTVKNAKSKKKPAAKATPAKKAAPKKAAKPVKKPVAAKKAAKPVKKAAPPKKAAAVKPAKGQEKQLKKGAKPERPLKGKGSEKEAQAKEAKGKVAAQPEAEEIETAADEVEGDEEVVLTDAEGRRYCRVKDCDQLSAVDGYCRYHYLLFWKKIQIRKKILSEGKLERYIEELTARYPDKFLDMLRKDLRSEKEFLSAIQELEIDESAVDNEFEDEAQTYIDEVRGMGETAGAREEEDF